ncbi:putative transcriptional regulator, PucR family [Rhodococcus sp. AW25M09]|uniref:PucR family transcriptional regulator n=1 Tax=Rhodococcus sp. AW25M09 TaxID=1268303 RepID=UPI0002ABFF7A|nr:helix-turn-helix domain-containing protein [Rhodococcus sp. AW25M09]CCQ14541.1 putative transcriptional regulator, PucR family [Rhodococcus sp. AW25M09]
MTTGDLSALADATATAVGGAVSVMDPQGFVIAYSSVPGQPIDEVRRDGILGKQVPVEYMVHHLDHDFRRSSTVHVVDVPGVLPRLAIAVSADGDYLGSIWCIAADVCLRPPDPGTVAAMTRAAAAAMPLLLARRHPAGAGNPRARALLTDPDVVTPPDSRYVVLAARVEATQPNALLVQLADLLELTFGNSLDAGCVVEDRVVLLVSGDDERDVVDEAEEVRRRAEAAFGVAVTFAIGGPDVRPRAARVHAQWLLDSLDNGARTATFEKSRVSVVLGRAADALSEVPLAVPAVERMLAFDAAEGTDYAATVLALLSYESNVAAASASLYLHANTFRYRLRRTKELFGLDLDDADTRLLVWMSLRLNAGRSGPSLG